MKPEDVFHVDKTYMSKTVITNAQHVVMQKIDMIYLGGSLRKEKRMSSKKMTEIS